MKKVLCIGNASYDITFPLEKFPIENTKNRIEHVVECGGGPGGSTPINGTYKNQTSTTSYNTYGFYTYDDYLLNYNTNTKGEKVEGKGTGASTTGTIYGIYDMSGGSYDRIIGKYRENEYYDPGFTTSNLPGGSSGNKYYEEYLNQIKGDATYETMYWYSDNVDLSSIPYGNVRGGLSSGSVYESGIFFSYYSDGGFSSADGFRVVLIP